MLLQLCTSCFETLQIVATWYEDVHVLFHACLKFFLLFFSITKTHLFKYIKKFHHQKLIVSDKNSDIFHISAQNIDCGYSLEPPRRGGSNECPQSMFLAEIRKIMYTPVNLSFTIKSGVKII